MKRFVVLLSCLMLGASMLWAQSPKLHKVWEYRPAPGQFINTLPKYEDGDDAATMAQKAENDIVNGGMVSLGGYGGYIVFSFDHPIKNVHGKYNLKVLGNSFYANANPNPNAPKGGSAEPGIVMVSRDANGNGLPDDPWYELAGSEYNKPQTVHNYRITYTRPSDMSKAQDVPWADNQGAAGAVHANQFHSQPYYPLWLDESTMVFEGTKLANNAIDESGKGTYWVLYCLPWGYADNELNTSEYSNLKLDWAVDADGNHVDLEEIHFVKVFTGLNQEAGWLGETSTEVQGALDWNMLGGYDTVTLCGSSYAWNGKTYTASGDYYHALMSKARLDSSVTLHLTLNPIYNIEKSLTACGSYTWHGDTYTESGAYTKTLRSVCGCDSTVTLRLNIVNSYEQTVNATLCDGSYEWEGSVYTESGTYTKTLTSVGGCDSVVTLNLDMGSSTSTHVQAMACGGSYTWAGQTYTKAGQYTRTFASALGCDSTVTLHLGFVGPAEHEFSATVCGSYAWDGVDYTQSGSYTHIYPNATANGCDSIATLHLTINEPAALTLDVVACKRYKLGTSTYTRSGTFTKKFKTANGCDSVITLNLTIVPAAYDTIIDVAACGSYTWHGDTYTESGSYTKTLGMAGGCDSIVTLNLTLVNEFANTVEATACGSYTWEGDTYTQSGTYTKTLTSVGGCDSVVTLNLTISNDAIEQELNITANTQYEFGGKMYSQSGQYVFAGTTAGGCDSIVRLNLTIVPPIFYEFSASATSCTGYEWDGEMYWASGVYRKEYTANDGRDSIVTLRLTINSINQTLSVTACGSYTWYGNTYTKSSTATQKFVTPMGCDSTVTLKLTIVNEFASTVEATACGSYTWEGDTYTESGSYTKTLHSVGGCDSTVTLNLMINTPVNHEFTASACGAYWWNGKAYTESGDYQQVLRTRAGCDSTVTLHLTIAQPQLIEKDVTVCGSYHHGGNTYTASGQQIATYGCDSTVRLNLTIHPEYDVAFAQTACESYTWEGNNYTASGQYTEVLTSAAGCDSTVTLSLTLLQPSYYTLYDTVCSGITWNGQHYSETGLYTHTIAGGAACGCDSIVMLDLKVNPVYAMQLSDSVVRGAGYSRNGFSLTANQTQNSRVHMLYLQSSQGCDSTVRLQLIVLDATAVPTMLAERVSLYPNPSSGVLQVSGTAPFTQVEVYSATGQLVYSSNVGQNKLTLNLQHLPFGVYTLRLCGSQGCITRRFVKM